MSSRLPLGVLQKTMLALAAVGILALSAGSSPASAATTSTLLYSVDGGATWSTSVTADPGQAVLVRQWFSNDGAAAETSASLATTLPTDFTLVPGSTNVCLNPSTTNPAAPSNTELDCAAANESAVWSGPSLQVSPSAGHYGESTGATVGNLPFGRKRYLNLQQCEYTSPEGWLGTATPNGSSGTQFDGNTNVSNTAATAQSCGAAGTGWTFGSAQSGFAAIDLLGKRYLNLHTCAYSSGSSTRLVTWVTNAAGGAAYDSGTNASPAADTALSCGAGVSPWSLSAPESRLLALPLNARYLNLHNCAYYNSSVQTWFSTITPNSLGGSAMDANTNVSNTPASSASCGAAASGWSFQASASGFRALDLLDTARSAGYATYTMTAPSAPSAASCAAGLGATEDFDQDGSFTSTPSGTQASAGTVTVDWSQLTDPCGAVGTPLADARVAAVALAAVAGAGWFVHRRTRLTATV